MRAHDPELGAIPQMPAQSEIRWVSAGWLRVFLPIFILGAAGLAILVLAGSYVKHQSPPLLDLAIALVVTTALFVVAIRFLMIRGVELSDSGIVFVNMGTRIPVLWRDLVPKDNFHPLAWTIGYSSGQGGDKAGTVTISWRIAREIFGDPRCPSYELSPQISKLLRGR
jgi:hypothetical protein